MSDTRRRFLKRAGLTAAATVGAVVGLPQPQPEVAATRPEHLEPMSGEIPSLESEEATPWALYQYLRVGDDFEATSPINVVVQLGDGSRRFDDLMDVFLDAGWFPRPVEYVRFAYNALSARYERPSGSAAQTYYGGFARHHVRCWAFGPYVSIQAHEDSAALPRHRVASYESTKHLIERLFDDADWRVVPDGARFANATEPDHDGLVTVIEP